MKPLPHILLAHELSGRWTIPILTSFKETRGRFTPLQHRLGISPSRLSDNLRKLEAKEILVHLSPYERRHPLLPEYELTEKGLLLQEAARAIQLAESKLGHGGLSEKLWNWPVLLAVHHRYDRFQSIRTLLQEATPRILSMRMKELNEVGLIDKQLEAEPRPGFRYILEPAAERPVRTVNEDLCSLVT